MWTVQISEKIALKLMFQLRTFIISETTQISKNWNVARAIKFSVIVKFEVYRVFSSHNTLLQQRRCLVIMKDSPEESDIADSNF